MSEKHSDMTKQVKDAMRRLFERNGEPPGLDALNRVLDPVRIPRWMHSKLPDFQLEVCGKKAKFNSKIPDNVLFESLCRYIRKHKDHKFPSEDDKHVEHEASKNSGNPFPMPVTFRRLGKPEAQKEKLRLWITGSS